MSKKAPGYCACAVGRHPRRGAFERRLARGASCYEIANEVGCSRETVRRHWARHLVGKEELIRQANALRPSDEIAQAAADAAIEPLELCARKNATLEVAFQEARGANDWLLALAIDKRQEAWSVYQSKLTGPLRKVDLKTVLVQNNNFGGGDWATLESRMVAAARSNPRITLVDFLHEVRRGSRPPLTIEAQPAND
jgi:hypothetical protein